MFGKLFKRKSVPSNDGNTGDPELGKFQYVKVYEIVLSNMEDTPVYELKHQLSVGSEIGNIVIADPSVSPRHATFILQDEVVSVIDHGSVAGTFINEKKIDPGKYIILDENDVVMIGDLEIRLKVGTASVPVEEIPEPPQEEEEEEIVETKPVKLPEKGKTAQKVNFNAKEHLQAQKKKKKPIGITTVYSANSLVRVFAVISDLLLSYAILVIFLPFDDFREFIGFIPSFISSLIDVDWQGMMNTLLEDYKFISEMIQDGIKLFSSTFDFVPLLIIYVLLRTFTTFLFGVSISEYALGIRYDGNGIWARIGGVLRVLIGIITWPFLIFDIPAIVSRRTLKEFITFTNIHTPSKFISILGVLFYLPLMIVLVTIAPLMQGLEPPQPIAIDDRIEQRVKVKLPEEAGQETPVQTVTDASSALRMEIQYNPEELLIVPDFKFQGVKNKLNLKNSLTLYQRDIQRRAEFEIFKTFDMRQLLGIGMKGNFFLYDKYPEIYNFVYEAQEGNPSFKKIQNAKSHNLFANEFIQFTKTAFSIDANNALEIMQTDTFLIKGLVDFKSSFLSLIEYKDFDQIGFIKLGNVIFMKISYNKQKPFDLIIPLIKDEGKVFKITYDKKENVNTVSNKLYKFNLNKTDWLKGDEQRSMDVLTALEVFDLFSSPNFKDRLSSDMAQALYAFYYESSAGILKRNDPVEVELWKGRLATLLKLLEATPGRPLQEGDEDPKEKLLQNFRDLKDAFENSNLEYFGMSASATV